MVMGEAAEAADVVVIGAGPAGYPAAMRAAELGRNVTLVNGSAIGGVCLHAGCIPSKALIDAADDYAGRNGRARDDGNRFDLDAWQHEKVGVVGQIETSIMNELGRLGVTVVNGKGRFTSRRRIAIERKNDDTLFLEFKHAVIATGSRPAPALLTSERIDILDSTSALMLKELPASLAVIGAGYIGIELVTAFAKLGTRVTLIEAQPTILSTLPAMLSGVVQRRLEELGVSLKLEATATTNKDGKLVCISKGGEEIIDCEKVLGAIGRLPNTDDLGLEATGISTDAQGRIEVAENRLVEGTSIAAVGDVTPGPMLAHKGTAEGFVAAEAICGRPSGFDPMAIPLVVFSDPELASAGYTEEEARTVGYDPVSTTVPLTAIGRAITLGVGKGFLQLVVDSKTNIILGVHIAAPHASEMIAEGVLAIEMGCDVRDLASTIHPHPTIGEGLQDAARRYSARIET